jgi:hypothetical protein
MVVFRGIVYSRDTCIKHSGFLMIKPLQAAAIVCALTACAPGLEKKASAVRRRAG